MPRRRKPSSSAFEFTGEEALAAEKAFKLRKPTIRRKPKISITQISPRSTITKVLQHVRPKATPKPITTSTPSDNTRNPGKSAVPEQTPPQPGSTTPNPRRARKPKLVTPPSSQPSTTSTPSRRSLRRRVPSFKLRPPSVAHDLPPQPQPPERVPLRLRIRASPKISEKAPKHEREQHLEEDFCHDVPLGQKRARQLGDVEQSAAVPQGKKRRSESDHAPSPSSDDLENTRGSQSEQPAAAADDIPAPHENRIEKQPPKETGVSAETTHQLSPDSVDGVGIREQKGVEIDPEHATENDHTHGGTEKDAEDMERPREHVPTSGPNAGGEKPSAELTEPKPCAEENAATEDTPATVSKPSTECKLSAEEGQSDGVSPAAEQMLSSGCASPESKSPFESPVTPLKPEVDVRMPDKPSDALQTNKQSGDSTRQEALSISSPGRNEDSASLPAVSEKTTPEKAHKAPTDASPGTTEGELQRDPEAVTKGSSTSEEGVLLSVETADTEKAVTEIGMRTNSDLKPISDHGELGSLPSDKMEEEMIAKKDEAQVLPRKEDKPPSLPTKIERNSPPRAPSGVMKRVRFTEPPPTYRSSERKLGFSGIVKMRRRKVRKHRAIETDFDDVSVAAAGTKGPDEKGRQLLLDELQYLLDGIFKTSTNGSKKGQTVDEHVVASSLQSLIKLLLRKSKPARRRSEDGQEDDSGVLVQILVEQPNLLKTIVKRLCTVLGKSRASDALLALVFVIILRSTPKILLLTEHELDILLNAFFRNSAASLKEYERVPQKSDDAKDVTEKEPQDRRRGKLGRLFEQKKPKDDILAPLLKLMIEAEVIEDDCTAFKRETEAASHLMGIAISLILRNEIETRAWMRDNRRLDKVVAVLYSCEKMMLSRPTKEDDQDQQPVNNIEEGAPWIVMEASLRILEIAVLDKVCQQRLARESRVSAIIIDLLKTIKSIKTGPMESEWMICAALRLCINLCYDCEIASKQLVDGNGQNVVLNCLVKECIAAGLLQEDMTLEDRDNVEESFDVRVLCLAVLASTVNQEKSVCDSFHEMQAEGMEKRERGAISLILEILRTAELEAKKEENNDKTDETDEGVRRRMKTTREEDAERERKAQFVMERKITIGYVCLLVGALACDNKSNREMIQDLLPGKSFIGVAAVLAEFLEFHHEVGVISGSMNRMYTDIIKKIVEPEVEKEASVGSTEGGGTREDLNADAEGEDDELDLLLDVPDDGEEEGIDVANQLVEDVTVVEHENTTLTTPVDGGV